MHRPGRSFFRKAGAAPFLATIHTCSKGEEEAARPALPQHKALHAARRLSIHAFSMADLEPPAKKARLDMEATSSSGPQDLGLDAPGSPVDDLDDDFYETSVAQDMVALPQDALDRGALESKEDAPPTAATEPASAAAPIPGLGHWGEPSTQSKAQPGQDGGSEDGELSDADEENFYEVNQDAPAAEQQSKPSQPALLSTFSPTAGVGHAVDASAAAALIPEGDEPKGLKRKASSSAQDLHALTPAGAPVPERTPTTHDEESKAEFLEAAQANKGNKDAEWELDSQASSSSSSDSSDDSALTRMARPPMMASSCRPRRWPNVCLRETWMTTTLVPTRPPKCAPRTRSTRPMPSQISK